MCIVLISNKHPKYPLILASNRDEFLARPTLQAAYWDSPNSHVLGGRDLYKPARGTWLGVTTDGRIAVLTNFREESSDSSTAAVSRGEMVIAFLTADKQSVADIEDFVKRLISGEAARGSGGFSLVCGQIGQALAVVSNRMQVEGDVKWIGRGGQEDTVGLSNAAFGDHTWPKVANGERQMEHLMQQWIKSDTGRESITDDLFDLLSTDTLPLPKEGESWAQSVKGLRQSIFVPKIGSEVASAEEVASAGSEAKIVKEKAMSGAYGTQKQTVVIVDDDGRVYFTEKTLFDEDANDIRGQADSIRHFEFRI